MGVGDSAVHVWQRDSSKGSGDIKSFWQSIRAKVTAVRGFATLHTFTLLLPQCIIVFDWTQNLNNLTIVQRRFAGIQCKKERCALAPTTEKLALYIAIKTGQNCVRHCRTSHAYLLACKCLLMLSGCCLCCRVSISSTYHKRTVYCVTWGPSCSDKGYLPAICTMIYLMLNLY